MPDNSCFILIGVGILLFALYKLWKIIDFVRRRAASASWPVTSGRIYGRNVKVRRQGRNGGKYYEPEIMYVYTVMSEEFWNTISLGTTWSELNAEKTVEKVAKTIEVRYNPDKPKEHISSEEKVRPSAVFNTLLLLVVGLLTLSIAVFGVPSPTGTPHGPR